MNRVKAESSVGPKEVVARVSDSVGGVMKAACPGTRRATSIEREMANKAGQEGLVVQHRSTQCCR